jgi:glycosyltransferase 2 family protein
VSALNQRREGGASPRSYTVRFAVLVGLPLSAFLFWLAFRDADLDEVWSVLTNADIGPVALAVALMASVYGGQAARWRAVARTSQVPTARFGEMVVSGVAVNNVLPGRVGDLLRARWLQVSGRIPAGRALATVFVDRSFDVLALVAFLAISLPFVADAGWLQRIAIGGLVLLFTFGLVLLAARVYTRSRARGRRIDRGTLRRIVRDTLDGLAEPVGRLRAVVFACGSLAIWAAWGLAAWLVARAVGIELSAVDTMFVTGVINLGVALPSSPGFVGTYQWLGVSALALLNVGTEQALAFAILLHAIWYVPTTLVGGALLLFRAFGRVRPGMRRLSRQPTADERT